jgi:hypothetical protein
MPRSHDIYILIADYDLNGVPLGRVMDAMGMHREWCEAYLYARYESELWLAKVLRSLRAIPGHVPTVPYDPEYCFWAEQSLEQSDCCLKLACRVMARKALLKVHYKTLAHCSHLAARFSSGDKVPDDVYDASDYQAQLAISWLGWKVYERGNDGIKANVLELQKSILLQSSMPTELWSLSDPDKTALPALLSQKEQAASQTMGEDVCREKKRPRR